MLIWYWSSDVCSSDLCACTGDADVRPGPRRRQHGSCHQLQLGPGGEARFGLDDMAQATPAPADWPAHGLGRGAVAPGEGMGRRRDRKRDVEGKGVSVSVGLGGRREYK